MTWTGTDLLHPRVQAVLSASDLVILGTRHGRTGAVDSSHRGELVEWPRDTSRGACPHGVHCSSQSSLCIASPPP